MRSTTRCGPAPADPTCDAMPYEWSSEDCYYAGDFVLSNDENIYRAKEMNYVNMPEYSSQFWEMIADCRPLNDDDQACDNCSTWTAPFGYETGDYVCHNGRFFRAKMDNICLNPDWNPLYWEVIDDCEPTDPEEPEDPKTCDDAPDWDATTQYYQNDRVIYQDCLF